MGSRRFILDTHAFVWALVSPARLGRKASAAFARMEAGDAELLLPAAALAEVCLLQEAGRIPIGLTEAQAALRPGGPLWLLPLDQDQLEQFALLGSVRDIFDRFILAAARTVDAPLVTRDREIAGSHLVRTLWS
jgi:PIN domain nuclease of toxin-antitoxin system